MPELSAPHPDRPVHLRPADDERLPDTVLAGWLAEDLPHGDLTTRSLPLRGLKGRMRFLARDAMCVACSEEAARLVELAGGQATVCAGSGSRVAGGTLLLEAQGAAPALLAAWKVAQTAMEVASGVATGTAAIVDLLRAAGFAQPLACTRKTVPGARALSVRGVIAGGGVLHRLGLSESLLVFPEHRAFLDEGALTDALHALHAGQAEKCVVVEVCDADEAVSLARQGVRALQLERFTPDALAALRARLDAEGLRPLLLPAGGVTRANALDYARAGADLLVSSAPYTAPRADVKVVIERA